MRECPCGCGCRPFDECEGCTECHHEEGMVLGPERCVKYQRNFQRARAEAAEKRVAELEKDAERLADELRETSKALWAIANAAADKHLDDIRGPIACAAIAAQADEALAAHEALRGTK